MSQHAATVAPAADDARNIAEVSCPSLGRPMRVGTCVANQRRYPGCVTCAVGFHARRALGVPEPTPDEVLAAAKGLRKSTEARRSGAFGSARVDHGTAGQSIAGAMRAIAPLRRGEVSPCVVAAENRSEATRGVSKGCGEASRCVAAVQHRAEAACEAMAESGVEVLRPAEAEDGQAQNGHSARPCTMCGQPVATGHTHPECEARRENYVRKCSVSLMAARRTIKTVDWMWNLIKERKGHAR